MLTTDLSPHLALITGATGGIGRATCHALASLNCPLAIHYHTALSTATTLLSTLRSQNTHIRAEIFQADLSTYSGVRQLHAAVIAEMGHPTILFNNAGVTGGTTGGRDIGEVSIEMFKRRGG